MSKILFQCYINHSFYFHLMLDIVFLLFNLFSRLLVARITMSYCLKSEQLYKSRAGVFLVVTSQNQGKIGACTAFSPKHFKYSSQLDLIFCLNIVKVYIKVYFTTHNTRLTGSTYIKIHTTNTKRGTHKHKYNTTVTTKRKI